MIPVSPDTRTTLILDKRFMCTGRFFTARGALRNLMNGRVKGWDADGNIVSWTGADPEDVDGPASSISWVERTVSLYPDQPCLRSVPNHVTGEETRWPIPTVAVCTHWFGTSVKKGQSISLRRLYRVQKGVCQYCHRVIPFSEATKDHVYPKDLGGSNDDFNLVLACKRCNSDKANIYPYYDREGKIPKPLRVGMFSEIDIPIRPEWRTHLHLEPSMETTSV